jgi:hypothetical protein
VRANGSIFKWFEELVTGPIQVLPQQFGNQITAMRALVDILEAANRFAAFVTTHQLLAPAVSKAAE